MISQLMYRRSRHNKLALNFSRLDMGKYIFFGLVSATVLVAVVFTLFSIGLPDPGKVKRDTGFSTVIADRTGNNVLYDLYTDQDRKYVDFTSLPEYLKQATIAVEDKDFYKHQGFDPLAIPRIIKNVIVNRRLIGGSTLTQQLVKQVLLTNDRNVVRKIKEFILATKIEKQYSKDEILRMYLNESPYGGAAIGVAAAAQQYFGKEVKDLTLTESVIIAGLPQAPSRYSPYGSNTKAFIPRATEVARRMREDGYITKDQEQKVVAEFNEIKFKGMSSKINAPHFVMYVKQLLEEMYGSNVLESGGYKVVTSLDWGLQQKAEMIVKEEVDKVSRSLNISNGSSVILDTNTGEILSMVGSINYFDASIDGQVNVATRLRQPGSSIKPLVYATAFLKGYSPSSVIADVETEFPGKDDKTPYTPKNYDGKEHGLMHLREALGSSINIPAVKLLALVGVPEVLGQGYKMGLTSLEPTRETQQRVGLSMALGGAEVKLLELASAYSAFANSGTKVTPIAILKIMDRQGKTIYENKPVGSVKVLDEKVAFLVNSVLSDNNARLLTFSANSYLNLGSRAVAVKTGTTNDLRDNWTIGWTKDTIVGVWVGNNDNEKMKNVASGVSGAAPIWRRQMLEVLSVRPDKPFTPPAGVSQVEIDKISGYPAHDGFASYKDWFVNGSVPTGADPIHTRLKVCKSDNNRLADAVAISQGNYDQKEFVVIKEKDPLTAKDLWQKGIDLWTLKQTDPMYRPPTETCNSETSMDVRIISPGDKSRVDGEEVTIRFSVASNKPVIKAELSIDGTVDQIFTDNNYIKKVKLTTGTHTIKVLAVNSEGKEASSSISFSLNMDYPSPTPTTTVTASPTP